MPTVSGGASAGEMQVFQNRVRKGEYPGILCPPGALELVRLAYFGFLGHILAVKSSNLGSRKQRRALLPGVADFLKFMHDISCFQVGANVLDGLDGRCPIMITKSGPHLSRFFASTFLQNTVVDNICAVCILEDRISVYCIL